MLSEPKIVSRPDQPFAAIRISLDREEIAARAPPLIGEVAGWLGSKGVAPAGAPFFNYIEMTDGRPMVMEVGFPTDTELVGDGRVRTGTIPAGRFATLSHTGPYDGLYEANHALGAWLEKQDEPRPMASQSRGQYDHSHLEIYWTDPQQEPDPQRWVTEVAFRLGQ
ncbi:GyrI-like domain-containing protein [Devosia sp. ZB163]|uniref:GyrI-like domain-containing protein n=1 Tax=Devosia sp. ZB163 TaxID=3025938 RepID=UPI0023606E9E|nr:GyrI-like domain-containing protein [Devosia sp. ZB163]MDC9824806.1 GyrI-like domain-containing protein [Devosia sp. ZB163]